MLTKDRPRGRPALVAPEGRLTKVLRIVEAYRTSRMFIDQPTFHLLRRSARNALINVHGLAAQVVSEPNTLREITARLGAR